MEFRPHIGGQDATETFYSLHRHEVLKRPAYERLHIGTIEGEKSVMTSGEIGQLSRVPYAEPTWLGVGLHSPYYKEVRGMYGVDELVQSEMRFDGCVESSEASTSDTQVRGRGS